MPVVQKRDTLRTMMKSYEGPEHTVVAMHCHKGNTEIIGSGAHDLNTAYDNMIFEIGSITKVFTAILFRLFVEEGKVDPNAPLRELLADLSMVPEWITPKRLASHTSGLPRIHVPLWKAIMKPLPDDPYADFSRADLFAWLRDWSTTATQTKMRHAYSNLGVGLLGEAMAIMEGESFMDLLTKKVIEPMGLKDTTDLLSEDQKSRFVQPRNTKGKAVSPWTFNAMAAAGCLRSSARDMARFSDHVVKAITAPKTILDQAICRSVEPVFGLSPGGGVEPAAQCSGWLSMKLSSAEPRIVYHDGATAGSACALYICPDKKAAIAILSNNGVAANLWADIKLSWSNQLRQAHEGFIIL